MIKRVADENYISTGILATSYINQTAIKFNTWRQTDVCRIVHCDIG